MLAAATTATAAEEEDTMIVGSSSLSSFFAMIAGGNTNDIQNSDMVAVAVLLGLLSFYFAICLLVAITMLTRWKIVCSSVQPHTQTLIVHYL